MRVRIVVGVLLATLPACATSEPELLAGPTLTTMPILGSAVDGAVKEGSGSDGPPATTPSGEPLGPVVLRDHDGRVNTDIYVGTIGRLGADQQIVPPVADPPVGKPGQAPLTGLPSAVEDRPAIMVKLDNIGEGRPQTGLQNADIVFEEQVEGGFTRLAAVYHSQSSYVGPVRSGRTTDIGLISGFGSPVLIYSGANVVTDSFLRSQPNIQNHSFDTTTGYWREPARTGPADLFTHLSPHWATASPTAPPVHFEHLEGSETFNGTDQPTFGVNYRSNAVRWDYDGSQWRRSQGGAPHTTTDGSEIAVKNVVVIETEQARTGMVDGSGAAVPEFVFVGSGKATIFVDGQRRDGTWTKPSLASVPTFTDSDGNMIAFRPGKTWIQVTGSADQLV